MLVSLSLTQKSSLVNRCRAWSEQNAAAGNWRPSACSSEHQTPSQLVNSFKLFPSMGVEAVGAPEEKMGPCVDEK